MVSPSPCFDEGLGFLVLVRRRMGGSHYGLVDTFSDTSYLDYFLIVAIIQTLFIRFDPDLILSVPKLGWLPARIVHLGGRHIAHLVASINFLDDQGVRTPMQPFGYTLIVPSLFHDVGADKLPAGIYQLLTSYALFLTNR